MRCVGKYAEGCGSIENSAPLLNLTNWIAQTRAPTAQITIKSNKLSQDVRKTRENAAVRKLRSTLQCTVDQIHNYIQKLDAYLEP